MTLISSHINVNSKFKEQKMTGTSNTPSMPEELINGAYFISILIFLKFISKFEFRWYLPTKCPNYIPGRPVSGLY